MRFPNEKKVSGKNSFFFVFASPDWQHGPDLHLLCKYKSLVVLDFCICIEDGGSSISTQEVENINTSLLIRVSLPHSGCRGKWKWGAIAEVSFWRDICHTGSVNKCDYVKGNSSTPILHTWCNLYDHFAISHFGTQLIRILHHRGIWFNYPLIRGWETSLN